MPNPVKSILFLLLSISITDHLSAQSFSQENDTDRFTPDRCNQIKSSTPAPPAAPESTLPDARYRTLKIVKSRLNLGIGHLTPKGSKPNKHWRINTTLPLFSKPGDFSPALWIHKGWIINTATNKSSAFNAEGMIETNYESPSFIVYEVRDDGWMKIRYSKDSFGTAWTHKCLTSFDRIPLVYRSWENYLQTKTPLFFRSRVRHSLRAEPTVSSTRIMWIPAYRENYHFSISTIQGDWMHIQLTTPSNYCTGRKNIETKKFEGWIKWKDNETGPWIWYYTRGC